MKKLCRWICIGLASATLSLPAFASEADSIKVEQLLREAAILPADSCRTLFYARKLIGIPYVANTLDVHAEETLVVHLDKADCTTFVETVLALAVTEEEGKQDFGSFKQALQRIRYRNGKPEGYASRLHYFSDWIKENERKGLIKERTAESPLAQSYRLTLNFMTRHPDSYRQLKDNLQLIAEIARIEQKWKDVPVFFIPKEKLDAPAEELGIKNGDILAIATNIQGLDVVHVGFACLVNGKVRLLHASSAQKKVILDPLPLFDYSKNKRTHKGVIKLRMKNEE